MNGKLESGSRGVEVVVKLGQRFWLGMAGLALGPAIGMLLAFWHLSDRVLLTETAIVNQHIVIQKLDAQRDTVTTLVEKVDSTRRAVDRLERKPP